MKTKTAAIKHALATVTLSNMGKQWRVDTYSPQHKAWREGASHDYWQARSVYSQACLDSGRAFINRPLVQYEGGAWRDYL